MRPEQDPSVATRVLWALIAWVAGTAVAAGVVIGLEMAGDRLMALWKFEAASDAVLFLGQALNFIATRVLLAPVRPATMAGWSPAIVSALALISIATWGALLAFAVRALVIRRRRTSGARS